eukprot:scaffold85693_cov17-Tisochrysis_lutea.AAC.1
MDAHFKTKKDAYRLSFHVFLFAQTGSQPAMEALPLVMEPESRMYTSPVLVLDFQSLYPSQ